MILSIISIVANIVFFVVLRLELFVDKATLPDGITRTYKWNAFDRLSAADMNWLATLQIALMVISIISAILVLAGIKNNVVKIIRLASLICSAIVFAIIMITSYNTHATY